MKTITIYLLLILSFLFSQDDYYEFIITPENTEFGDNVGNFVSILNGEMIINRNTSEPSSVSDIYHFINNEWVFIQTIDYNAGNFYFQQLYEDAFIRSYQKNGNDRIKFYEKSESGIWNNTSTIFSPDNYPFVEFGKGFYKNGDLLITNSTSYVLSEGWFPRIYVYRFNDISWQLEYTYDPDESHMEPNGLYIDDNMFIIGYPNHDITEEDTNEGAIQFFHYNGSNWEPGEYMLANNPTPSAKFGHSIIMNGDELIITAPFENDERGIIYFYRKIDAEWTEVQSIQSSDIELYDNFGNNIAVKGNFLLAGGAKNDDAGSGSGSAYVFQKNDDGYWVEIRKIISSDIASMDIFGASVDIDDTHIVVGAPFKNGLLGSVYVYELADTILHSNFATYPVVGNAPLTLNFNDLSQGNPTSWQWDFDSDGVIDSEEQYPEHTYQFEGEFTVTLTVGDGESTSTFAKENYINVTGGLIYGDIDQNGEVNILDIINAVDFVLGNTTPTPDQLEAGDMNNSGTIDIIDLVLIVNVILE